MNEPAHDPAAASSGETRRSESRARWLAALYGLACHVTFGVGVAFMAAALGTGMQTGLGSLTGGEAVLVNAALLVQFPVFHSWALAPSGRRWLGRLAPAKYRRTLGTTLYAMLASLQVLVLFALWSPLAEPFWRASGSLEILLWCAVAAGWLVLGKSMWDAQLSLQTGSLGWWALFRGRKPEFGPLPTRGLFAVCRQPIYFSFALLTWLGPVWTLDRFVVGGFLTVYCVLGPLLKERRFSLIHGEAFARYQREVPYLPFLRRSHGGGL